MRRGPDDGENPFDKLLAAMTGDGAQNVDVHEYDDEIRVVADIPGTTREQIDVRCDGRTFSIHAEREARPFLARVDLPAYVDEHPAETSFNNGVLVVTLDRETDPANIGFQ